MSTILRRSGTVQHTNVRRYGKYVMMLLAVGLATARTGRAAEAITGHTVKLDSQGKIIPWYSPAEKAYSEFLHRRWNFIKTRVPPSPGQRGFRNVTKR